VTTPAETTPAKTIDILYAFLAIPYRHICDHNWGTAPDEYRDEWEVNDETYINGVLLTIDGDYWMGYLIEAVDRTTGVVTFMAINTYHGHRPDGSIDHDFMTYEPKCGTFFDRTDEADPVIVGAWAVSRIYGMAESYFEAKQKRSSSDTGQ
jgi:hypothetical protein